MADMAERVVQSPVNHFTVRAIDGQFAGKDFISVDQLGPDDVTRLFEVARNMESIVARRETSDLLAKIGVAILFYEPSTRTFGSFSAAAHWLGASRTLEVQGMSAYSSALKGETLPDTIRSIEQITAYDLIVLRHPEDNSGYEAAHYAKVPVVSGGAGTLEHPTQAMLDLYTIQHKLGRVSGLRVGMLGDLKNGRTVKSLGRALTMMDPGAQFYFIGPEELKMPETEVHGFEQRGARVVQTPDLQSVLPELDVLYVTRIQKERFPDTQEGQALYDSLKGRYIVTPEVMKEAKPDMIVMHPLPRVDEISPEFDADRRAVYFDQMGMGLYIRMALLALLTGKD
jgi:aspartate carbamoyltransferase catalytic subunit